jgi:aromatic ring-cleaving dioxygenase
MIAFHMLLRMSRAHIPYFSLQDVGKASIRIHPNSEKVKKDHDDESIQRKSGDGTLAQLSRNSGKRSEICLSVF